eukprot:c4572_g1_i2.p1 GENE.c4572_g1_i2~~c4572_g1_i2.p1  ORF type:complete len:294 (+),score=44.92 c4572_g1_i2:143-1024(+)
MDRHNCSLIFLLTTFFCLLVLDIVLLTVTNVDEAVCGDSTKFPHNFVLYEEKFSLRSKMSIYDVPSAKVDLDKYSPTGHFFVKFLSLARTLRYVDANGNIAASLRHIPFTFSTYQASTCNSTDYFEISGAGWFNSVDFQVRLRGPTHPEQGTLVASIAYPNLFSQDAVIYSDDTLSREIGRITKVGWFWRDLWEGRCETNSTLPCYVVGFLGHLSTVLAKEARNRRIRSTSVLLSTSNEKSFAPEIGESQSGGYTSKQTNSMKYSNAISQVFVEHPILVSGADNTKAKKSKKD